MNCDRQETIIKDFSLLSDWEEKYEYIIDLGNELPIIKEIYKTNEYLVSGCQSSVWVNYSFQDGLLNFTADSDAVITKGLISMIISVYNHLAPKDIIEKEIYFIDKIGLSQNLSPNRSNGLIAMINKIKQIASKKLFTNE